MSTTTRRVVARKAHLCDQCATPGKIEPGHVYLRHTVFPGAVTEVIMVVRECLDCAHVHGRSVACYPIPENQPDRYWLGDSPPSYLDRIDVLA